MSLEKRSLGFFGGIQGRVNERYAYTESEIQTALVDIATNATTTSSKTIVVCGFIPLTSPISLHAGHTGLTIRCLGVDAGFLVAPGHSPSSAIIMNGGVGGCRRLLLDGVAINPLTTFSGTFPIGVSLVGDDLSFFNLKMRQCNVVATTALSVQNAVLLSVADSNFGGVVSISDTSDGDFNSCEVSGNMTFTNCTACRVTGGRNSSTLSTPGTTRFVVTGANLQNIDTSAGSGNAVVVGNHIQGTSAFAGSDTTGLNA